MKSKKRRHASSDESEDSKESEKSSSSSSSESEDSSVSEHRHKKKRKRAESSESDSDSGDQKHSKKRKHKKKKKKHVKRKRRSHSEEQNGSVFELESISEGEITSKKKRKHKHKHGKRDRSSSISQTGNDGGHSSRRLHSVVKERRGSSEERSQPIRTYYQKEYRRSHSAEVYDRQSEVQRFYRGSSKEHKPSYTENYQHYERPSHNDRYEQYNRDNKYDKNGDKPGQSSQYLEPNDDYRGRQRDYNEYNKRPPRYDANRLGQDEFQRRMPRDELYHSRQDRGHDKGYNRFNQFEDRGPRKREYNDNRDHWDRRGPGPERFREREYPDKKEDTNRRYREEDFTSGDRPREPRREEPPRQAERPAATQHRNQSRSPDGRAKERARRPDNREERDVRSRDARDERRERARQSQERPPDAERPRTSVKPEPRPAPGANRGHKKSRFGDANDTKDYNWGKTEVKQEGEDAPQADKEKPNFGLSGKLTADVNTVNGVVIKYAEPDDAKQPKRRWRFYPFKGDKALPILYIHRQSAFLIGRDKKVADIPLEHPSVSKQHAALQYRAVPFTRADGSQGRRVRPYIIDLDSANGTFVNNKKIEPRRYVELLERDVVKFGFSQREYVLLHENSKDEAQDDDHTDAPETSVTTADKIKQEKRLKQVLVEDGE